MSASLLVELFTEELPPKALRQLGEAFGLRLQDALIRAQLVDRDPRDTRIFATPRRLAVLIKDVRTKGLDRTESKKLMPCKVAFGADGRPSTALAKRLEKEGATADQVERKADGDAEYAFLTQTIPGLTLAAGLQLALEEAIAKLPIPKVMNYQLADGATTVQFVRPVHGLLALHGADVIPVSILGLNAGRITHGHRFQGAPDIPVAAADAYEEALAAHGRVIASFDERRAETERLLRAKAAELGASLGPESDVAPLLDEVTALVEYPSVYVGAFEPEFLVVPQECLVLTMRTNQKYFPLFDAAGKLTNQFLIVSNMRLADPKNIVEGNNRVVRPRLADARFFFETDKKIRLEARVPQLGSIVYHNKLGRQLERVERVQLLAGKIAREIGADPVLAERAAWLAKADLVTSMVGEFPELQGIMGRYYALSDGEPPFVAIAIEEHYRPRFAGDALPTNEVALALALADKLETLAGMFGIGQQPTGDKDPFALRRHALGLLRILTEKSISLNLPSLIDFSVILFPAVGLSQNATGDIFAFILDRARYYYRDKGYPLEVVESVVCLMPEDISEIPARLDAVVGFLTLPESKSLAAANKRIGNILKKSGDLHSVTVDPTLLEEGAEKILYERICVLAHTTNTLLANMQLVESLRALSSIKEPVDVFFDNIMVMTEDPRVRDNRLALLTQLQALMNRVADISKLAT